MGKEKIELPIVIEPLPQKRGFAGHLGAPFHLAAKAAMVEEAHPRLAQLVQQHLQEGLTLRSINIPERVPDGTKPGCLPENELTRDWLE